MMTSDADARKAYFEDPTDGLVDEMTV